VLPGRILEVSYEALVDSPDSSKRQLLDFCGLPWHEPCLHFEDHPAPIATYSAVQAGSPLYRSAIQRWKNYASELAALQELLTSAGIQFAH
jgi:hypothetical protein